MQSQVRLSPRPQWESCAACPPLASACSSHSDPRLSDSKCRVQGGQGVGGPVRAVPRLPSSAGRGQAGPTEHANRMPYHARDYRRDYRHPHCRASECPAAETGRGPWADGAFRGGRSTRPERGANGVAGSVGGGQRGLSVGRGAGWPVGAISLAVRALCGTCHISQAARRARGERRARLSERPDSKSAAGLTRQRARGGRRPRRTLRVRRAARAVQRAQPDPKLWYL